ncbi:MAG TPA: NAD(P)H-hydrate dehydratase, partial [Leptospiraceae bacterium]|nr:NAD(P)H-hydrate dehydratase [Leptospiraceae bacterium]
FIEEEKTDSYFLNKNFLKSIYKRRDPFAHKGNYGKALLVSGSYGKMGAAILAARGCLRSGVGLLTVQVPKKGVEILQISVPEAMVVSGKRKKTISEIDWKEFDIDAIAIGPGIGKEDQTLKTLTSLLTEVKKPMVLDADALNLISENPKLLDLIQPNTILTPHFKEFERLVGKSENDFHRISLLRNFAKDKKIFIVLKGKHTAIATPEGDVYFNGTGNPGMATGGSGDVLTGVILSLLAQGYEPLHASLFGVYLHGLAGDIAAKKFGEESLLPSDLINYLGNAFLQINNSY